MTTLDYIRDGSGGKGNLMFGSEPVLSRMNPAALREIARRTEGELILEKEGRPVPLGEHYRAFVAGLAEVESTDRMPVYRQRQGWFLWRAFVLLALTLLIPDLRGAR